MLHADFGLDERDRGGIDRTGNERNDKENRQMPHFHIVLSTALPIRPTASITLFHIQIRIMMIMM